MTPLFGILQLDRGDPLGYAQLPGLLQAWVQDAGGFAAVGLVVYLIYAVRTPTDRSESERLRVPLSTFMVAMAALALVCYAVVAATVVLEWSGTTTFKAGGKAVVLAPPPVPPPPPGTTPKPEPIVLHSDVRAVALTVGGLFAGAGILHPFVRDLRRFRWRRIGALSRLTYKEAFRSGILWVFALVLLQFLFPSSWFTSGRPVDELRATTGNVSLMVNFLALVPALIVVAFAIPRDIARQTIHTVVTKPVERFEIVLGRFFGYVGLMTVVLAGMVVLTLGLILATSVDPSAVAQTRTARVPVRGTLDFQSRRDDFEGTNVGREFEYRKYIAGDPRSTQRAVWSFPAVPGELASAPGDRVPAEFTFDIYRTIKGSEDRGGSGVTAALRFVTHNCPQRRPGANSGGEWPWADAGRQAEYEKVAANLRREGVSPEAARPGGPGWDKVNALAEEFGFYEVRGLPVVNNQVLGLDVPAGLFRNAAKGAPTDGRPAVQVYVKSESPGQMIGVAGPDLYLLAGTKSFAENYGKWAVGVWCRMVVLIGLGVACSTYLTGVITLLIAGSLFLCGFATEHIQDVALNRSLGGGPFESFSRLVKAQQPTAPIEDVNGGWVLLGLDKGMAWLFRRFQNVVPDVESFGWSHFLAEGFNVNTEYLAVNLLVTAGYLLPWAVLAYYLMKSREIAS